MEYILKRKKPRVDTKYVALYLSADLINKVEEIATANKTSFNNVVVSMIKKCLDEENYTT